MPEQKIPESKIPDSKPPDPPSPDLPQNKSAKKRARNGKLELQALILEHTQNMELAKALNAFTQMRERIRKPLTLEGLRLTLRELDKLAQTDEDKIAILEQSIQRSWQGVFPLKENIPGKANHETCSNQEDELAIKSLRNYEKVKSQIGQQEAVLSIPRWLYQF